MGIVDLVADIFRKNLGEDVLDMLRLYEETYPPDWGLEIVPGSASLLDFITIGGDIAIVGFWYNASLESIIALATQDMLLRMLVANGSSRFLNDFGIGPIEKLPREAIEAAVALAASQSPYISDLKEVQIINGAADTLDIRIKAITPTGDAIGVGLTLGSVTS